MTLRQMECPKETLLPTTDMKKKWKTAAKQQQTGCCSGDFCKTTKIQTLHKHKALRTRQIQGKHKDKTFAIQPLKNQGGCSGGTKEPQLAGWQGLTVESDNADTDSDEYDNCVYIMLVLRMLSRSVCGKE